MIRKIKALQNPPTSRSCPHKQAGTFRTSFERDFICNDDNMRLSFINFAFNNFTYNLGLSIVIEGGENE